MDTIKNANVIITPLQSTLVEETFVNESEDNFNGVLEKRSDAPTQVTSELHKSINVEQPVLHEETTDLAEPIPVTKKKINVTHVPNESVTILEENISDSVSNLEEFSPVMTTKTFNTFLPERNATLVSENDIILSEEEIKPFKSPNPVTGLETYNLLQEMNVSEVFGIENEVLTEKNFIINPVLPTYNVKNNEYIETSETVASHMSEKYFPEIIVATESASQVFKENEAYMVTETLLNESEQSILENKEISDCKAEMKIPYQTALAQSEEIPIESEEHFKTPLLISRNANLETVHNKSATTTEVVADEDLEHFVNKSDKTLTQAQFSINTLTLPQTSITEVSQNETNLVLPQILAQTASSSSVVLSFPLETYSAESIDNVQDMLYEKTSSNSITSTFVPNVAVTLEEPTMYQEVRNFNIDQTPKQHTAKLALDDNELQLIDVRDLISVEEHITQQLGKLNIFGKSHIRIIININTNIIHDR